MAHTIPFVCVGNYQSFGAIAGCCTGVFGLAFCEGSLLCKVPFSEHSFALRYAVENILPSVTHATRSASDVCLALGRSSKEILIEKARSQAEAQQLVRADMFKTWR